MAIWQRAIVAQGVTMLKSLVIGATALFLASAANAAVVLSSNFDTISTPTLTEQGYDILSSAEGWTGGEFGLEVQDDIIGAAFSPMNLVELDTTANSSMFVNLVAGTYTVSYYYSPRPNVASDSNGIDLMIGSTLLDSITGTGGSETVWQLRTVNFTTTGGALTFLATGESDALGGYLDNITIETAAIPEPATWVMLITGFGLVGFAARRRRTGVIAA
jgi:hypothetical protein